MAAAADPRHQRRDLPQQLLAECVGVLPAAKPVFPSALTTRPPVPLPFAGVCWVDPFAPGSIFGSKGHPGVRGNDPDYSGSGSGTQKSFQRAQGNDKNGVFHPTPTPADASIKFGYPGLYFRTYTAGSLFPGNSMDLVKTDTAPFYDRGGMTSDRDQTSWDRSAYTVRSPGQEHPRRWYAQYEESAASGFFSEVRMWHGGAGGNTMCMAPGVRNEMISETGAHTQMFQGDQDLEICQKPVEGMASHTCADQNNRGWPGIVPCGRVGARRRLTDPSACLLPVQAPFSARPTLAAGK